MYKDYLAVIKHYPRIIAFGFLASFFTQFGQTYFIGLYGEDFREAFHLSNTDFGTIYSGVTLFSAFAVLSIGHLVDKVRLAPYVAAVCVLLASGCFLIYSATYLPLFIIGLGLVRFLGQGLLGHVSGTITARYVRVGRGRGLSLASMGHPLGEILCPFIVVGLLIMVGWRESWLIFGACYLFIALPLLCGLSNHRNVVELAPENSDIEDKALSSILHDPMFWLVLLTTMFMPFFLTGIFFHQQWLMENMGLADEWFAISLSCFGVGHIFSNLFAGHLVDRFGAMHMLKVFLLPFMVASIVFVLFPHPLSLILLMLAAAATVGTLNPLKGCLLADRYGTKHLGAMKSIMSSSMVFSTALSPALFGVIIDNLHNASIIFHIGWICTALGTLIINLLPNVRHAGK